MENLNLLIKPSSNKCNLKCKYCFYEDVSHARQISDYDYMEHETAKLLIDNVLNTPNLKNVHIGFQGGEPTLSGIDFYEFFFSYVASNQANINVTYSLQTNGVLIDAKWAKLLKQYNVLVGLSLDGPATVHDNNRVDFGNKRTHSKVMNAAQVLKDNNVDFNILAVVTNNNALKIDKIYNYFIHQGFDYIQFIPALNPLDYKVNNLRAVNDLYYTYLSKLFKVWSQDVAKGRYVSIRFFDNMMKMMLGHEPEACDMRGVCSIQNIVEADGSTFTCDFYALDKYNIGNATTDSFYDMMTSDIAKQFIVSSAEHPSQCKGCIYYRLCRNGCNRMRSQGKYIHCEGLQKFLNNYGNDLYQIAITLTNNK